MKAQTIRIKCRKDGTVSVKGNGDLFSFRLETGELVEGVMKPSFGYKLRRFLRRLRSELREAAEDAIAYLDAAQHGDETPGGEIVYDLEEGRVVYSPERAR